MLESDATLRVTPSWRALRLYLTLLLIAIEPIARVLLVTLTLLLGVAALLLAVFESSRWFQHPWMVGASLGCALLLALYYRLTCWLSNWH